MTFEERVSMHMMQLNDVEDDIVEYLKANKSKDLKIREIARELYIAPNTVIRLAKKLGYDGFSEMRYAISHEQMQNPSADIHNINSFYEPELSQNIIKTVRLIDKKNIKEFLQRVCVAENVIAYGIGESHFFCELLIKYLRSGEHYFSHTTRILCDSEYSISKTSKGDVVVLISASGETSMLLDLADLAHQHDAWVVSITSDSFNRLRAKADQALLFSSGKMAIENFNAPDLTGLMILIRYIANMYWNTYLRN